MCSRSCDLRLRLCSVITVGCFPQKHFGWLALTQFRMQFANDNLRHLQVVATLRAHGLSFGSWHCVIRASGRWEGKVIVDSCYSSETKGKRRDEEVATRVEDEPLLPSYKGTSQSSSLKVEISSLCSHEVCLSRLLVFLIHSFSMYWTLTARWFWEMRISGWGKRSCIL